MMGGTSVTNSAYSSVYDGRRRAYGYSSAAWRASHEAEPADATEYVTVPADAKFFFPRNLRTYARGESGTVTVNVVELDPPV